MTVGKGSKVLEDAAEEWLKRDNIMVHQYLSTDPAQVASIMDRCGCKPELIERVRGMERR